MNPSCTTLLWTAAVAGALATSAPAQTTATADRGRFAAFEHGQPVATERFEYLPSGDSIFVKATVYRKRRDAAGVEKQLTKSMNMVVNAFDFGLRSYVSNMNYDGHLSTKGIIPGDTAMTVYSEVDKRGTADRLVQPPSARSLVLAAMLCALIAPMARRASRGATIPGT